MTLGGKTGFEEEIFLTDDNGEPSNKLLFCAPNNMAKTSPPALMATTYVSLTPLDTRYATRYALSLFFYSREDERRLSSGRNLCDRRRYSEFHTGSPWVNTSVESSKDICFLYDWQLTTGDTSNSPFYSCMFEWSTWPLSRSEARGYLVLIQTSLSFIM